MLYMDTHTRRKQKLLIIFFLVGSHMNEKNSEKTHHWKCRSLEDDFFSQNCWWAAENVFPACVTVPQTTPHAHYEETREHVPFFVVLLGCEADRTSTEPKISMNSISLFSYPFLNLSLGLLMRTDHSSIWKRGNCFSLYSSAAKTKGQSEKCFLSPVNFK